MLEPVVLSEAESLKKIQSMQLSMLIAFADFCRAHDLNWFLDSGTALGAIRHKGFIPWDDDIDVGMPRSDYDALLEMAMEFPRGFSLHTVHNTKGYTSLFAKMYIDGTVFQNELTKEAGTDQGIYIDIFPYDYLLSNEKAAAKQKSNARYWQAMLYMYFMKHVATPHNGIAGYLEKQAAYLGHYLIRPFFSPDKIERKFNRSIPKHGSELSDSLISTPWPQYGPFPKDVLFPTGKALFEGHEFPVPAKPEQYLEIMYGDWKTLPKPSERHTHMPTYIDFGDGTVWGSTSSKQVN